SHLGTKLLELFSHFPASFLKSSISVLINALDDLSGNAFLFLMNFSVCRPDCGKIKNNRTPPAAKKLVSHNCSFHCF
ncbi:hypothetical protein NE699_23905, partial [Escherichia coli]|nr:hypothetical protein [Escherichia coli]